MNAVRYAMLFVISSSTSILPIEPATWPATSFVATFAKSLTEVLSFNAAISAIASAYASHSESINTTSSFAALASSSLPSFTKPVACSIKAFL